jgi:hypothetical protein
MSKAINNPNFIATNDEPEAQAPITGQIVDGFDFPHTGLIKAFNLACAGSYAINGFNGTNIDATQATFAGGDVFLKGELVPITGATVTITATSYNQHLLVARGGNVVLIQGTATDVVPSFADGDVIIALLKYTGSDPMQIQYLTFNQTSKSLSVGHIANGEYVESGKITGDSNSLDIVSTPTNADINITPNGNGKIVLDGLNWPIADGNAAQVLTTDGNNGLFFSTVSSNSITDADGDTKIQIEESADEDKIRFDTANNERMIIDNNGNVGIGTSTPLFALDIANGGLRTSANIVSLTDISANNGSVSGNVISATTALNNSGYRTKSKLKAARVNGHAAANVYAHATISQAVQHGGLIDGTKEVYYVGMNTDGGASHQMIQSGPLFFNGMPVPIGSNNPSDFYTITEANYNVLNSGDVVNGHTYNPEDVFGGGAIFVPLIAPELASDKEVIIHNVTGFALYVIVINPALDPSNNDFISRNRFNGGFHHHTQFANITGNDRLFNLGRLLLGIPSAALFNFAPSPPTLPHSNPYNKDAILIKPRESVRLSSMKASAGEIGNDFEIDWHAQQGLLSNVIGGQYENSQWMITSSSNGTDKAQMAELLDSMMHVPVHYTGTTFICEGDNEVVLPDNPEDGTQFAFLCIQGTTTITLPQAGNSVTQFGQNFLPPAFFEAGTNPVSSIILTAGDTRTFVAYTSQQGSTRGYQVIG